MFMVGTIFFEYSNASFVEPTSVELMGMEDQLDFFYFSLNLAHHQMTLCSHGLSNRDYRKKWQRTYKGEEVYVVQICFSS